MSFKIPCGGFKLDEKLFSLDKNDVLSIPKPLTYDYMPEGYPKKDIEYVTLMEEQEVTFSEQDGLMEAVSPVTLAIKQGDKLTVVWDGASYDVEVKIAGPVPGVAYLVFGNLGLVGVGVATDYPFLYVDQGNGVNLWSAADTAASHTIKVMRQQVTIAPMSTDFMPPMKNLNVVFKKESGSTQVNCNVTYNELRDWVERDVPVFAVFINAADYSQCNIFNITGISLLTDMLGFVYYISGSSGSISKSFVYKSDGTIETRST